MKRIKPTNNAEQWPRKEYPSFECRKRDLVIRISDWTRQKEEPAFDVEVYVGGVYDFNLSETFTTKSSGHTKDEARALAIAFASKQIAKLL